MWWHRSNYYASDKTIIGAIINLGWQEAAADSILYEKAYRKGVKSKTRPVDAL
jgi:hypothetical protein